MCVCVCVCVCAIFLDQRKIDDLKVLTRRNNIPVMVLWVTWSVRLSPAEFDGDFLGEMHFVGIKDDLCLKFRISFIYKYTFLWLMAGEVPTRNSKPLISQASSHCLALL